MDLALGVVVVINARLVTLLIVLLRERYRSARVFKMVRSLPRGSRYVENGAYVMIDIGSGSPGNENG